MKITLKDTVPKIKNLRRFKNRGHQPYNKIQFPNAFGE